MPAEDSTGDGDRAMRSMGWRVPPARLELSAEETASLPLLRDFELGHPGVKIVWPHYADEPWRVVIDAGTVPGDGRMMTGGHRCPSALLDELTTLFGPP